MKHITKYFVAWILWLFVYSGSAFAAEIGVNTITTTSPNTLEVEFTENPNLKVGEIEAEVKILRDISLRGSFLQNTQSVEVLLEEALLPNTSYSLLTIIGWNGSIDFVSPELLEGATITNTESAEDEDIESIEIIDSRNIVVNYKQTLTETSFEYKLLAESTIEKIENPQYAGTNVVITVTPPLTSEQDYILMFIDLRDMDGKYLEFDTGIYDFTTPTSEEMIALSSSDDGITGDEEESETEETTDDQDLEVIQITETNENVDDTADATSNSEDTDTDLTAAGPEQPVNTVAASAVETPDTGAETWVLIIASLFINSIFYLSRRKKSILA